MEDLKVGDIIKERYELVKFLGSGSFGEVWLALDIMTGREVALKIYQSLDPAGVEEFQREYSNTIDLSSPYLLTPEYFDVFHRRPFLVMKYCERGSSSKLAGNISEEQLWAFIEDVSKGLDVLHSLSDPIVHQDIKPDNILVDNNGRFLITDFGISKRLRATMRRQSKRDVSSGAMPYMAPERFDSNPKLTTASDIWSLGASIYELATGELPFSGFGGAMQRNGAEMPKLENDYSSTLNSVMQSCLAPSANERPTAKELVQCAKQRTVPVKAAPLHNDTQKIQTPQQTVREISSSQKSKSSNSNFKWVWFIIVALVISGIVLFKMKDTRKIIDIDADSIIVKNEADSIGYEENDFRGGQNINSTSDAEKENLVPPKEETVSYNTFRLGDGLIMVPDFLHYKGESDDGGPIFEDNTGGIRLFANYAKDQDMNNYHWWVTNEIGNGNPVYDFSKGNYMVQSGYNHEGEIYYAKWHMDYSSNPSILYTLTIIYPQSENMRVQKEIPKMFNKFPNIK